MNNNKYLWLLTIIIAIISCNTEQNASSSSEELRILQAVNKRHNIEALKNGQKYSFVFRTKKFTYQYTDKGPLYISETYKNNHFVLDSLINNRFSRYVDGKKVILNDEDNGRAKNSLNSVLYFATLPLTLNDTAVNLKKLADMSLDNKQYYCLQVTFDKEGGGDDYDDVFVYWISKDTYDIDYIAYYYHTNKGGSRLRKAFNQRYVNDVRFQDYINYKPKKKELTLDALLSMFNNQSDLDELSFILTEQIIVK